MPPGSLNDEVPALTAFSRTLRYVPSGNILAAFCQSSAEIPSVHLLHLLPTTNPHLEIPGDQTPPQSFGITLAALHRDLKPLQILLELLPNGHGSRKRFEIEPVGSAPFLRRAADSGEGVVCCVRESLSFFFGLLSQELPHTAYRSEVSGGLLLLR